MDLHVLVIAVFVLVYLGMALGRWPGLAIDRTGIALIGAIVVFAAGAVDAAGVAGTIDFAVLAILFALMVLSAQFAASGFFEWAAGSIAAAGASPRRLLAVTVLVAGGLAAVLTNDVIVWAMVPVLVRGLRARGLDPVPFVIALAMAANAGSAATVVGNPQNLLIASAGGLGFWPFVLACGVPAALSLAVVYGVVAWRARDALAGRAASARCCGSAWCARSASGGGMGSAVSVAVSACSVPAAMSVKLVPRRTSAAPVAPSISTSTGRRRASASMPCRASASVTATPFMLREATIIRDPVR